ncbi:unnamed protein product [Prunus brigantina]
MSRDESRMVRILMICPLDRRSVLLNSHKRGRLMSSLRELKPDKFGDHDMLRKYSGHLHQSKSGSRSRRSAHPSNHHVSAAKSRAVKRGVDSSSLIPLEVRLA